MKTSLSEYKKQWDALYIKTNLSGSDALAAVSKEKNNV